MGFYSLVQTYEVVDASHINISYTFFVHLLSMPSVKMKQLICLITGCHHYSLKIKLLQIQNMSIFPIVLRHISTTQKISSNFIIMSRGDMHVKNE